MHSAIIGHADGQVFEKQCAQRRQSHCNPLSKTIL
jgi:hypothetical protein